MAAWVFVTLALCLFAPASASDQALIACQTAYLQSLATAGTNTIMQCAAVNELVRCVGANQDGASPSTIAAALTLMQTAQTSLANCTSSGPRSPSLTTNNGTLNVAVDDAKDIRFFRSVTQQLSVFELATLVGQLNSTVLTTIPSQQAAAAAIATATTSTLVDITNGAVAASYTQVQMALANISQYALQGSVTNQINGASTTLSATVAQVQTGLSTQVAAEVTRAIGIETSLANRQGIASNAVAQLSAAIVNSLALVNQSVANEIQRAMIAESNVAMTASNALGSEQTRATTSENALGVRIDSLTGQYNNVIDLMLRQSNVTSLLNVETSRAIFVELQLASLINSSVTTALVRAFANDTTLGGRIDSLSDQGASLSTAVSAQAVSATAQISTATSTLAFNILSRTNYTTINVNTLAAGIVRSQSGLQVGPYATCDASAVGFVRYSSGAFEGCDGTSWRRFDDTVVTVSTVTPSSGLSNGGTPVTLTGSNFFSSVAVTFNGVRATNVVVVNPTTITCVTPPGVAGPAIITVTRQDGAFGDLQQAFTYLFNAASFGLGTDGDLLVDGVFDLFSFSSNGRRGTAPDAVAFALTSAPEGRTFLNLSGTNGLAAGDMLLVINLQGTAADSTSVGVFETAVVTRVLTPTSVAIQSPLARVYSGTTFANQKIVAQRLPQYNDVRFINSGQLTVSPYAGLSQGTFGRVTTGILGFLVAGTLSLSSSSSVTNIDVSSRGFRGGVVGTSLAEDALRTAINGGGDGAFPGSGSGANIPGGAGGVGCAGVGRAGNGGGSNQQPTLGGTGNSGGGGGAGDYSNAGAGGGGVHCSGSVYTSLAAPYLLTLGGGAATGGGGGAAGPDTTTGGKATGLPGTAPSRGVNGGTASNGGAGGGLVFVRCNVLSGYGRIVSNGGTGGSGGGGAAGGHKVGGGGGGGGANGAAGGSVYIQYAATMWQASVGSNVFLSGGSGGGGGGGAGVANQHNPSACGGGGGGAGVGGGGGGGTSDANNGCCGGSAGQAGCCASGGAANGGGGGCSGTCAGVGGAANQGGRSSATTCAATTGGTASGLNGGAGGQATVTCGQDGNQAAGGGGGSAGSNGVSGAVVFISF